MSNSIAPGSSVDVNVKVTALTTNQNVPVTYKTVILKKNLVNGVNTLTQDMMSATNTKYVIKYDYVLSSDITVPKNCILNFDGGNFIEVKTIKLSDNNTIVNGKITFADEGYIIANNNTLIDNCVFNHTTYCKLGLGTIYADKKENIIIQNCKFNKQQISDGSKCSSIDLRNCIDFLISNNTIRYSEGENIILFNGVGIISNNILYNGWSCVGTTRGRVDSENPTQEELANEEKSSILITGNNCHNAIAAGITINTSNVTCSNNIIEFVNMGATMYGPGIRFGHTNTQATNCIAIGNTIKCINSSPHPNANNTAKRGISLDAGNDNIVKDNYIEGFTVGMCSSVLKKGNIKIVNNIICSIKETGISIYHSLDAEKTLKYEISGNNINSLEEDCIGVSVNGSYGYIEKNSINLPNGKAINILNSNVYFIDNNINSKIFSSNISDGDYLKLEGNSINITEVQQIPLNISDELFISCNRFNGLTFKIYSTKTDIINNYINATSNLYIAGGSKLNISNNIFEDSGIWFNNNDTKVYVAILNNIINSANSGIGLINFDNYVNQCKEHIVPGHIGKLIKSSTISYNIDKYGNIYPSDRLLASDLSDIDIRTLDQGSVFFNTSKQKPYFKGVSKYLDGIGYSAEANRKGTTSERPLGTAANSVYAKLDPTIDIGFEYFDTTLSKPIYVKEINNSTGIVTWVDATGVIV